MHENRPRQHSRFMFMHTIHTYSIPTNIYPVCIKGCSHKDDTGCSDNWKKYSYMYHIYRISYLHWQSELCVCVCVWNISGQHCSCSSVWPTQLENILYENQLRYENSLFSLSHTLYITPHFAIRPSHTLPPYATGKFCWRFDDIVHFALPLPTLSKIKKIREKKNCAEKQKNTCTNTD